MVAEVDIFNKREKRFGYVPYVGLINYAYMIKKGFVFVVDAEPPGKSCCSLPRSVAKVGQIAVESSLTSSAIRCGADAGLEK